MRKATFQLTGWHVLAALLGFFALVVAANAVFLTVAVRTFPGERVEKSYLQGLTYNETLRAREAQAALGWRASLTEADRDDAGAARLTLTFTDVQGRGLNGLTVSGAFGRPAAEVDDRVATFASIGGGAYQAVLPDVAAGAWRLEAVAEGVAGERFELASDVRLP